MIRRDKRQTFANIPLALKERLIALRTIDPVLLSESRVIAECLEKGLPRIEQRHQRRLTQDGTGRKWQRAS